MSGSRSSSSFSGGSLLNTTISEKLTREDFLLWQTRVLPEIYSAHLFGYLDGSIEAPEKETTVKDKDGVKVTISNPDCATTNRARMGALGAGAAPWRQDAGSRWPCCHTPCMPCRSTHPAVPFVYTRIDTWTVHLPLDTDVRWSSYTRRRAVLPHRYCTCTLLSVAVGHRYALGRRVNLYL
jgi:hypothetical protein